MVLIQPLSTRLIKAKFFFPFFFFFLQMEVSITYDLGMDYISRFDVPKAIDCFEKSLDIAENAGDQATVVVVVVILYLNSVKNLQ